MDSIAKLKDLADKNGVSFEELCVYALGTAQQGEGEGEGGEGGEGGDGGENVDNNDNTDTPTPEDEPVLEEEATPAA